MFPKKSPNKKFFLRDSSQAGVTLFLAMIVMASVLAISFSLATILFVEIRVSGDLLKSEGAINGAEAVAEEALFFAARGVVVCSDTVTDNCVTYSPNVGNVDLTTPPPTPVTVQNPILQDQVLTSSNTFGNTANHYYLYDPEHPNGGSGFGKIRVTYLDTNNHDNLHAYICQYDPNSSTQEGDTTAVCSDPGDHLYWLNSAHDALITPGLPLERNLDPTKQQELMLFNSDKTKTIYITIETFADQDGTTRKGIPYFGQHAIDITGNASGLSRKIKVLVPNSPP